MNDLYCYGCGIKRCGFIGDVPAPVYWGHTLDPTIKIP